MKNTRPLLIIIFSILIGAIAVGMAVHWIGVRTEIATIKVVVATRDLPFGTQLQEDMLTVMDWPSASTLKDAVANPKNLTQRVINASIQRGEPVLTSKLAPIGEKGGLSALLHEGTRAVTVKVNEIVGVAGFALPGNYVDVMVHAKDRSDRPISKIVLERILVLALAQDASTSETKPRVVNAVTLEVTPQQAEQIDLARSVGSLSLILRSQVDTGHVATVGVSMEDLFGRKPTVAPIASKPLKRSESIPIVSTSSEIKHEVIRGATKTLE